MCPAVITSLPVSITQYSLPLPKGGRHADNPVPTPDQRVTHRQRRKRMNKVDPLDPDYIAGSSPFARRDVTSRVGH